LDVAEALAAFLFFAFFVCRLTSSFPQGIRDVRGSPPPVPEDARRRSVNRARAEEAKKKKDAKEAKRTKKLLAREKLDARRRRQRLDGLPLEPSPSSSVSDSSSDGGGREVGTACLGHLPDIREMVPGAPARSLTPLGGGGGVPGPVAARPGAEADTPEARVSEERAVSPMGSTAEVERVTVGATPLSPRRVEEVPGSDGGQLALVDTGAALLPPPLPLQRRQAVSKRLHPRSR